MLHFGFEYTCFTSLCDGQSVCVSSNQSGTLDISQKMDVKAKESMLSDKYYGWERQVLTQVVNKVPPFFLPELGKISVKCLHDKRGKKSKYEIRQMPTRGRLLQFQHRLWYRL